MTEAASGCEACAGPALVLGVFAIVGLLLAVRRFVARSPLDPRHT